MGTIKLININKSFGKTEVLNNQNYEIEEREFLTLADLNNCGKSILLCIIAGLEHKTYGDIYISDEMPLIRREKN